jgi:outer membrane scaffolding protein for murein synthesis (MipA/OmpV family)
MTAPFRADLLERRLLAGYDVTRHWLIVGSFELRKLYDQAADSVLTERTTNHYVSAGLAYRF